MRTSLTRRRLLAIGTTLTGSAAVGAVAGGLSDHSFALTATVFAAATVGPMGALAWLLLVAPRSVESNRNPDDDVEHRWAQTAAAGAFTDLLVVLGLGLAIVSIADLVLKTQLVLLALVVLAMGDASVRYVGLERRGR
ncbi:hypothetical protein [Terrabacter sp. BE26]|uniref:hypothetical protein n=1 Tax=Terrabacter sp. BE26 TaxID=2898152 RepID=UPI0035BE9685